MPLFFQAFVEPLVVEEPLSESYSITQLSELLMTPVHQLLRDFTNDKSQSELLFLLSIALAVSLFAVILPAYEALFGSSCLEGEDGNAMIKNKQQHETRIYKPGLGLVEMSADEIAELTLIRSSIGGGCSDCDNSMSSICSLGSWSLETIEESEEEDFLED